MIRSVPTQIRFHQTGEVHAKSIGTAKRGSIRLVRSSHGRCQAEQPREGAGNDLEIAAADTLVPLLVVQMTNSRVLVTGVSYAEIIATVTRMTTYTRSAVIRSPEYTTCSTTVPSVATSRFHRECCGSMPQTRSPPEDPTNAAPFAMVTAEFGRWISESAMAMHSSHPTITGTSSIGLKNRFLLLVNLPEENNERKTLATEGQKNQN